MEQKQVTLIGLRASNHGIIQACNLTPDILSKKLVLVTGSTGHGKSTLMDLMKTAIAGPDAIKKKDALEKGYLAEAQLLDGDVNLFIGAKVSEYVKGDKAGQDKFETFLYAKDDNGKHYQPIIDGVAATPSDYVKMLTTELTFSLPDLHSENQTTHRKLIEKLFKPELDKLGAEKAMEDIESRRRERDAARMLCQANGAYMERFKEDGYTEQMLMSLVKIDEAKLEAEKTALILEKDRLEHSSEDAYELAKNKIEQAREKELQEIKDKGLAVKEKIRQDEEGKAVDYRNALMLYESKIAKNLAVEKGISDILYTAKERFSEEGVKLITDTCEAVRRIDNIVAIEPHKQSPDQSLLDELESVRKEYAAKESEELTFPEKGVVDTTSINKRIAQKELDIKAAVANNELHRRYQLQVDWIAKNDAYLQSLDVLRKMYASVDCGVEGMRIVPRDTESGRIDVWLMYDGSYDTAYFSNPNKELRFMFDYSSFQRTVIGLMLQSARLNLKKKALRIAFVDDVAFTERDVAVLKDLAERLDLKLITAWTHEAEKENLIDGQILVEGGEVFF